MPKKYKFKIENKTHNWDGRYITGQQVRDIPPGIPDNMDLWVKLPGEPGRLVADEETIDLAPPGIEKFYSQDSSSVAG